MPTDGSTEPAATSSTPLLRSGADREQSTILTSLITAILLFFTAIAMTIPIRPIIILKASSNDASLASYFTGAVNSLQALITIFSSPLLGSVSDVTGRKPILLLSHLGEFVGLLLVATFPMSLIAQAPAYMLIALTNAYITTVNTIIADMRFVDAHTTATNYGYVGAAVGLCFLIGPAVGGLIEDSFYLASSFHVACVLIVLAMLFIYFCLPETNPGDDLSTTPREIINAVFNTDINPIPRVHRIFARNEALTWVAFAISSASLAQSGLNAIIFLYTTIRLEWGSKQTGFFLSMVGLSLLISQAVLAPLSVRLLGETPTIILGYALSSLHYVIYGLANTSFTMYVGLFVGMFSFIADPAMKGLLSRQVSSDMQGSLQGSVSALTAVVRPLAPILAATFLSIGVNIGKPGLPFFVIGAISALSLICVRVAFWKPGLK